MEQELNHFIEELGAAINASLAESDRFAAIMSEMEQAGYDAYVVLEASIGLRRSGAPEFESSDAEIQVPQPKGNSDQKTEMTAEDLDFLRELRIAV